MQKKANKIKTKQFNPNLTQSESERLFEKLVDQGDLAMDPEGWWRWTT